MEIETFRTKLNSWGRSRTPFLFAVDFEMQKPLAWPVGEVDGSEVWYDFNGATNRAGQDKFTEIRMKTSPEPFEKYNQRFDMVMAGLYRGNSFLTNLTIETPVLLDHTLEELYQVSEAKYKLLIKNTFLVFSPETFVQIHDG